MIELIKKIVKFNNILQTWLKQNQNIIIEKLKIWY